MVYFWYESVLKQVMSKELKPRKFGLWKGKVFVPDNFNDEDEEINKLFYEGEIFPKEKNHK